MNENQLAVMISRRKSVRSYSAEPLAADVLADILSFAEHAVPLFPKNKTVFRILGRDEIRCVCPLSAPHFMAVYAGRSPDSDLNCGFMLQQVSLYLSAKNIGSCWLGMASAVERTCEGLPLVILLSFGNAQEPVLRDYTDQFRRKSLAEISVPGVIPAYIEALRLAPSAMNKQPWFFTGDAHCCHAFSVHGMNLVNVGSSWRFVDLGIALSHLYLAATADGKKVSFRREDSLPSRKGCEYVISCRLSDD